MSWDRTNCGRCGAPPVQYQDVCHQPASIENVPSVPGFSPEQIRGALGLDTPKPTRPSQKPFLLHLILFHALFADISIGIEMHELMVCIRDQFIMPRKVYPGFKLLQGRT